MSNQRRKTGGFCNIFFTNFRIYAILRRFPRKGGTPAEGDFDGRGQGARSAPAIGRARHDVQLREGYTYDEIAAEEGVSPSRIRQIVSQELQQRAVDSGAEHAKLQLDRLAPAIQLAAEGIAAGDISAITPYLKVLDRLDRYQVVASANQAYDDEARKKLLDKINRMAANYGIDEAYEAAVKEHLKKQGVVFDDEPGETEALEDPASPPEEQQEGQSGPANWMSV